MSVSEASKLDLLLTLCEAEVFWVVSRRKRLAICEDGGHRFDSVLGYLIGILPCASPMQSLIVEITSKRGLIFGVLNQMTFETFH